MNAYELADELDDLYQQDCIDGVADLSMPEAADMLRQQADRIAKLNEEANNLARTIDGLTSEILTKKKPLSDEEMDAILYSMDWAHDPIQFGRAIEKRHGIK